MSLTYVVTGASRGLGLEFVNQLAAKGNTVIACARNPGSAAGLQKLVDNKHVFAVKMDTTSLESIKVTSALHVFTSNRRILTAAIDNSLLLRKLPSMHPKALMS